MTNASLRSAKSLELQVQDLQQFINLTIIFNGEVINVLPNLPLINNQLIPSRAIATSSAQSFGNWNTQSSYQNHAPVHLINQLRFAVDQQYRLQTTAAFQRHFHFQSVSSTV